MSELFNLPKNRLPEAKSLQTQIIMGNQSAKMSWSDSKTHYLQGTSTLYVEGDAQKTKPKTIWRGGLEFIVDLLGSREVQTACCSAKTYETEVEQTKEF